MEYYRPLILYAYAESTTARENLGFFLRKGLHDAADFVFIFNGETNASQLVPDASNIEIVERSNTCFDLGAYGEVLRKDDLWTKYKRFILLNASIRGPFLPTWSSSCWSDLFLDRLTAKKKLIGMTLNCQPRMHIQSMIMATDKIGMYNLLDPILAASASVADQFGTADDPIGLSGCYPDWNAAVHAEVGTTSLITSAGYEVDALMTALHSERSAEEYCKAHPDSGDLLWDKKYFGGNIHPYETVFAKTNRNVDKEFMAALTEFHLRSEITSYTAYGLTEVDIIIAGGGTAGCVVASRLSDADPSLSILVVECGQDKRDDPTVIHPIFSFGHMAPGGKTMLNYPSIKEPRTADRVINTATASLLGGGSAINMSTYQRPQRFDYDSWKMPAFTVTKTQNDFIQAANQVGYPEVKDLQDFDSCNGVQRNLAYIGKDGKRQDAAHNYLYPRLDDGKHPNLHVLVEHQVSRILFEGTAASGVEIRPNPLFQPDGSMQTIKARKLVIAASGAMATPLLLERSGLGDPEILSKVGVDVVADLPGVGTNYQDHQLSIYAYYTGLTPEETGDALFGGRIDVAEAIQAKAPILGWHLADSVCKVRPTDQEVASLGSEFQEAWDRDFKPNKEKPIAVFIPVNSYPGFPEGLPVGQYFGVSTWPTYPYSRGQVHIASPSLDDAVDFRPGFLTDDHDIDLKKSMWAYKKQRELMRRTKLYRGEVQSAHPPFPAGSAAACAQIDEPLQDAENIVYSAEDDAVLEKHIRENIGGCWHQMGTCKMSAREKRGVVDASLNVYGVQRLKIADLSIAPENLAANLANTAFVIGEKAASLIIAELGL
ncbi:hypothetical protein ACHAPW_002303 [Verticillium nonalfalfae]